MGLSVSGLSTEWPWIKDGHSFCFVSIIWLKIPLRVSSLPSLAPSAPGSHPDQSCSGDVDRHAGAGVGDVGEGWAVSILPVVWGGHWRSSARFATLRLTLGSDLISQLQFPHLHNEVHLSPSLYLTCSPLAPALLGFSLLVAL